MLQYDALTMYSNAHT